MRTESINILLAEDNEDDAVLVQRAFKKAKLLNLLQVVPDGEEALKYLKRLPPYDSAPAPGLVLLDINMPKKDGFEVLTAMKADADLRRTPVVMLTTSTREEDIARSFDGGACSYISKPVNLAKFVEVVAQFELYWTLVSRLPKS